MLAWRGVPTTDLNKVSKCLKKTVRVMMFKNKHESTEPLFEYLSIAPININIKLKQRKFMKQLSF